MRIGLISTYGVKCGIATYAAHLANQLAKEHEVIIFAEDYLNNEQLDFNSDLKVMRCFNRNYSSSRLLEALRTYPCDMVHIQHEYNIFSKLKNELNQVAAKYKGRTAITLHTVYPPSGVFDLQESADCFIIHNDYGKEYLLKQGIKRNIIKIIPHGTLLLPRIPSNEARVKLRLPQDRKIILTHSFIERRKNLDKIIKAVATLKNELPIIYIHVGTVHPHALVSLGQSYLNECNQLIRELDVVSEVMIINRFINEEELGYYLAAADIIIIMEESSYPEIHGSGVLHTVAPGKPIMASDIPDFAEVPDDAIYKIANTEKSVEKAIRDIFLNPEFASRLSDNFLIYAQATSWENTSKIHAELYEDMLNAYEATSLT